MTDKIVIYTDGACRGNPGPGGWAYQIMDQNDEIKKSQESWRLYY